MKHKRFIVLGFAIVLATVLLVVLFNKALQKPFWNDEIFDIFMISSTSLKDLSVGHTLQPNNNPLYYVLQKSNFILTRNCPLPKLIKFRFVSIFSAVFLLLLLYDFTSQRFSVGWAVFIWLTFFSQGIFLNYAVEARHYMLWLLCFVFLILSIVNLCSKKYEECDKKEFLFFCMSCLLVTLVISMGVIQVFFAVMVPAFIWICIDKSQCYFRILFQMGLIFLGALSIELSFCLSKLVELHSFAHSSWDLLDNLHKGDYSLLKMPLRLLLPKPGEGYFSLDHLLDALVVTGLCMPILQFFNYRKELGSSNQYRICFILGLVILFQLMATVIIAVVVAYFHFYFVQRVFLNLTICHSLLAMLGGMFWLQMVKQLNKNKKYI